MIPIHQGNEKSKDFVLTKALLRAAQYLNINRTDLALILGISEPSLSRLYQSRLIAYGSKEGQIAVLFLKIYQYLYQLFGSDLILCKQWLNNNNAHLNGIPLEHMKTIEGIVMVVNYLTFMQDKI